MILADFHNHKFKKKCFRITLLKIKCVLLLNFFYKNERLRAINELTTKVHVTNRSVNRNVYNFTKNFLGYWYALSFKCKSILGYT